MVCQGTQDFAYLKNDDTDWASLQNVSFWFRHRERLFVEVVRRYPPTGLIYEVGAGDGSVSRALQNAGHDIVAIEPTVGRAKAAKRQGVRNVVCATIENAGFDDGQFSNVGLFDVLGSLSIRGFDIKGSK